MRDSGPRRVRRQWLRRLLVTVAVVTPIVLVALWFALHHVPGWYQPVEVTDARLDDVRADAANTYSWIGDGMVTGQAFDLVLDERQVSEWLGAGERLWPDLRGLTPHWIEDPVVRFRDGRITLGARLHLDGKELIAGVQLTLALGGGPASALGDGAHADDIVTLRLARVTGGSLPVPVGWLARPLSSLLRMDNRDLDALPPGIADQVRRFRESEPLQLLSRGIRRANRFIWENGRRPYRIAAVQAEGGRLTLTIDPL